MKVTYRFNRIITILAILFVASVFTYHVFAAPPTSKYQPGETLDPGCAPGDPNCAVQVYPDLTGNAGKYLTTNGSTVSWATVSAGVSSVSNTDGTLTISPTSGPVVASLNLDNVNTWSGIQTFNGSKTLVNGNLGIGTVTTPLTALDIEGDGAILAAGGFGSGVGVPVSGGGVRMMWMPSLGAFRAGSVSGTQWDSGNVGNYSVAFGDNTIASGVYSVALGLGATASGSGAVALGSSANAIGVGSVAIGIGAQASDYGIAFGPTTASGQYATSFGLQTIASGGSAAAFNASTTASGYATTAFGIKTNANSFDSLVLGSYNIGNSSSTSSWIATDPLFEVGNGNPTVSTPVRSDAFIVLKNGNTGINTAVPKTALDIEGDGAILAEGTLNAGVTVPNLGAGTRLMWYPSLAAFRVGGVSGTKWDNSNIGEYSVAIGFDGVASGAYSAAFNVNNTASGNYSTAFGEGDTASGQASVAFNSSTHANGIFSAAFGDTNTATGQDSSVFGFQNTTKSYDAATFGTNNIDNNGASDTTWVSTDPLFEIGNGTPSTRSDAVMVLKNGNTGINLGTTTPYPLYNLQVGNASVSGVVARFQNSAGTCDINPLTSSLTCSSDMNLKKNITLLSDGTSAWSFNSNITVANQDVLTRIMALTPVNYNWTTEAPGAVKHPGFIAQDVKQIFPDLVATDPTTGLLSLNYTGLIPYTVEAVQEMNLNITDISDMTRANTWRDSLIAWLGSATNGITSLVVQNQICVDDQCLTKNDIHNLLQLENQQQGGGGSTTSVGAPAPSSGTAPAAPAGGGSTDPDSMESPAVAPAPAPAVDAGQPADGETDSTDGTSVDVGSAGSAQ